MFRDDFRVTGYIFGEGKKALCVVGSVRGNEYQQIYTCSMLIKRLTELEGAGLINSENQILIIPSLNPYSMNIGKRFWPTDNTDINRMFPGYSLGETTQRIADGVFKVISQYDNGIQFASFYMPGTFSPHVRIMKTGFENVEKAKQFGMNNIVIRNTKPYDTTTLNYNWQIWNTDAFSLYTTSTTSLDTKSADQTVECVLRFMAANDMINPQAADMISDSKITPRVFFDKELMTVRPNVSGIFLSKVSVDTAVTRGQLLATVLDTSLGTVLEYLRSPIDGTVFFLHNDPFVYANTGAIKILPEAF